MFSGGLVFSRIATLCCLGFAFIPHLAWWALPPYLFNFACWVGNETFEERDGMASDSLGVFLAKHAKTFVPPRIPKGDPAYDTAMKIFGRKPWTIRIAASIGFTLVLFGYAMVR